jgi:hypothetical protein
MPDREPQFGATSAETPVESGYLHHVDCGIDRNVRADEVIE